MHEIVMLAGAERDLLETYVRLETITEGLGDRFEQKVERGLRQIATFPESAPLFRGGIRRLVLVGYPHALFYVIETRRVMVQAILDLRQSPERILQRLSEL